MKKISILILSLCFMLTLCPSCAVDSSSTSSQSDNSLGGDTSSDGTVDSSVAGEEKEVYYTVQFDTDGAKAIQPVKVLKGEKITKPDIPNKTTKECEYIFLGWFYNGEEWDFEEDVVVQDMTLVAHWEEGEKFTNPFLPKD